MLPTPAAPPSALGQLYYLTRKYVRTVLSCLATGRCPQGSPLTMRTSYPQCQEVLVLVELLLPLAREVQERIQHHSWTRLRHGQLLYQAFPFLLAVPSAQAQQIEALLFEILSGPPKTDPE